MGNSSERAFRFWMPWIACAVYLLLPTRNYNGDGLALIQRLQQTAWWENFDPNHFAWAMAVEGVWTVGQAIGVVRDSWTAVGWLQAVMALVGALAIGTLGRFAARLGLSPIAVVVAQIGLAGSFAFWHFATDIAMYVPLLLLSLLGLEQIWSYREDRQPRSLLLGGLWLSAALLLHQLAILSVITAICWLWPAPEPGRRFTPVLQLLSIGIVLVGGPYVVVAEWLYRDTVFAGLGNFLFGEYSGGAVTDWGPLKYRGDVLVWLHAVLLGHWHAMAAIDHPLVYDSFRRLHGAWSAGTWGVVLPAAWMALSAGGIGRLRQARADPAARMLITWLLPGLVLFLFLNPAMLYYRLIYWSALVLMIGWLWDREMHIRPWIITWLVAMLGWNGMTIVRDSPVGKVPNYRQALAWKDRITDRDAVITARLSNTFFIQYLRAFNGAHRFVTTNAWLVLPPGGISREEFRHLDAARMRQWYRKVYLDADLAAEFSAKNWIAFPVRLMPDYSTRTITLSAEDWELGPMLEGAYNGEVYYQLLPRTGPLP